MDELRSLEDLLDLHEVDRQIDRLLERRAGLAELGEYRAAHDSLAQLTAQRDEVAQRLREIDLDLDKANGELELTEDKATREESRLYAGGMSARDADYLRREVENLRARVAATEDRVLVLMEAREQTAASLTDWEQQVEQAATKKEALEAVIKERWARIDAEVAALERRKGEIVPLVVPDLMEVYDELRSSHGGDVVGRLHDGICGACHLKLSAAEEAVARKEDPPRCVHCRAILVP